jgi:predicted permease
VVYLDSRPYTVVGVAAEGFGGTVVGISSELWVPTQARGLTGWSSWVVPIGRLRPGVEPSRASSAVDAIAKSIPPDEPQTVVRGARLDPMTGVPGEGRGMMIGFFGMLMATAGLVLLIASVNVAGMLLSRAVARRRELAVRLAIGSGRRRLVQQLLTETMLLFLVGGVAGLWIAIAATRWLEGLSFRPFSQRLVLEVSPDLRVLGFGLLISLAAGLACGLAPALRSTREDLNVALKDGAPSGSTFRSRGRSVFVAAQLAMSVLLLITAGLFVRSLQHGMSVDPGFDADGVVVAGMDLGPHGYDQQRGEQFYSRLMERVRTLPGVEQVSLARIVLLSGVEIGGDLEAREPGGEGTVRINSRHNRVDPSYFSTLKIPLVAGRTFTDGDGPGAPPVVVLNETAARRLWEGSSPLGKHVRMDGAEYEVIGVVRDGKYAYVTENPVAVAFFPTAQGYTPALSLHVRSRAGAEQMLQHIRAEVRALDPNVALEEAGALSRVVGTSLVPLRFAGLLVGLFGAIGLLLAAIGVYGVLSFHVAQRTREIGIRIALGARTDDVLRLVVGRGARLALTGGIVGLVLAAGTSRLLGSFLFGVSPVDAVTFTAVPALLMVVALAASYIPARRAALVEPMVALRED